MNEDVVIKSKCVACGEEIPPEREFHIEFGNYCRKCTADINAGRRS